MVSQIILIILNCLVFFHKGETQICTKVVTFPAMLTKAEQFSVQETYWNFLKRKYRVVTKTRIVNYVSYKTKLAEKCCDGYYLYKGICLPLCDYSCRYGKCIAPNKCACDDGYIFDTDINQCSLISTTPEARRESIFGFGTFNWLNFGTDRTAISVDITTPNMDIEQSTDQFNDASSPIFTEPTDEELTSVDIESFHFTRTAEDDSRETMSSSIREVFNETTPIYSEECVNGIIIDDICDCFVGYTLNDDEICTLNCEFSCKNGSCIDNRCNCLPGYKLNDTNCIPDCEKNCHNGDCVNPNECKCLEGFIISSNDPSSCIPQKDNIKDTVSFYWKNCVLGLFILIVCSIFCAYLILKYSKGGQYSVHNQETHHNRVQYTSA